MPLSGTAVYGVTEKMTGSESGSSQGLVSGSL